MKPLHGFAKCAGALPERPLKLLGLEEALACQFPPGDVVVDLTEPHSAAVDLAAFAAAGFAGARMAAPASSPLAVLHDFSTPELVGPGDVFRFRPAGGQVSVLYRRGANANSLFVTERCNSLCLMCSQPPRETDDSWRLPELHATARLIDRDLPFLGVTGGEPTLLGDDLAALFATCREALPDTRLHVLTNGRRFAQPGFAARFDNCVGQVEWAVPLYADVEHIHDYVVQASGAFDQAVAGLYALAERGHSIEVRFVLHAVTAPRLRAFADFVWRNLPFAHHVALMGLEPMGYARMNRALLWQDPADYADVLADSALFLEACGIACSIYNLPLCVLPESVHHLARQSISDWKNNFDPLCAGCTEKDRCAGFFASAGAEWKSRAIRPFSALGDAHGSRLASVS